MAQTSMIMGDRTRIGTKKATVPGMTGDRYGLDLEIVI